MKCSPLLVSLLLLSIATNCLGKNFLAFTNDNEVPIDNDIFTLEQEASFPEILKEYRNNNFNHDRHYRLPNGSFVDPDDDSNSNYIAIMNLNFYGSWRDRNHSIKHQFQYLDETSGFAEFRAFDSGMNIDDNITFVFYNGEFRDQKAIFVNWKYENSTDFNPQNATFKNNSITFRIIYLDDMKIKQRKECNGSYQLSFINSQRKEPYQKYRKEYASALAELNLKSTGCEVDIVAKVEISNSAEEARAMQYIMIITIVCLSHLYGCVQIIRHITLNESDGTRYSLITIVFITGWDIFLCLFNFHEALTNKMLFHYHITPAFWYFILSSILEARLLLLVWKAKFYNSFQTTEELRRGLTSFYGKFYLFLFVFTLVLYHSLPKAWVLYATSLFFIPQIIHNAMRGQKYKFDWCYVFLLCATRMLIPIYARGYAYSKFRITPAPSFAFNYTTIMVTQILLLYLQSKLGSRFFIPSCFLPKKYDYYVKNTETDETEVCSICMENITPEVDTKTKKKDQLIEKVSGKIMKTPCRHYFHEPCLKGWMDIKLECPFCRAALPAVE